MTAGCGLMERLRGEGVPCAVGLTRGAAVAPRKRDVSPAESHESHLIPLNPGESRIKLIREPSHFPLSPSLLERAEGRGEEGALAPVLRGGENALCFAGRAA